MFLRYRGFFDRPIIQTSSFSLRPLQVKARVTQSLLFFPLLLASVERALSGTSFQNSLVSSILYISLGPYSSDSLHTNSIYCCALGVLIDAEPASLY